MTGTTATTPHPPAELDDTGHEPTAEPIPPEGVRNYSFTFPPSLMRRLRSAQWHTLQNPDGHQTVSGLVRAVVAEEVARLEDTYNGGLPFPEVEGRLPPGPGPAGAQRGAAIRAINRRKARQEADSGA
ncbi:hypothetical protein [Streptomyces sp. NPDC037389]|uniref:hypothetical protein n=1 Tax=Streptomyces sp. NPDC037389 TaxID=3155369 RepID=UPI003400231B